MITPPKIDESSIRFLILPLALITFLPGCSLFSGPGANLPSLGVSDTVASLMPGGSSPESRYVPVNGEASLPSSTFTQDVYHAVRKAKQTNSIVLQVVGDSEAIRILPLPDVSDSAISSNPSGSAKGIFVSTLLNQTGVLNEFRKVQVAVFRPSPSSFEGVRMDVLFESRGKHQIRPESDYSLHSGDRVVVRKDDGMSIDSLVDIALGR
jgi:hypothetical protein